MIRSQSLIRATLIGTALQIVMVVAGHYSVFIAQHVFMFGGMAISAVAGLLYRNMAGGYGGAALGGAIAGGACALIGIAVSVVLGDTAAVILAIGTLSSAVTGAVGGLIARAVARS
jgi:hypothetical protein